LAKFLPLPLPGRTGKRGENRTREEDKETRKI
jgi:hypothetical protein